MILAIGNSGVWEVEAFNLVKEELEKRGYNAILFKQDKCLGGEYLIFEIRDNKYVYSVVADGKYYDIRNFSTIWCLKPQLPRELLEFGKVEYRSFINKQFYSMREALWSVFRDKKWINDPWAMYRAENKIYQLKIASDYFSVPDTIVTSNPEYVREFYDKHSGDIIIKILETAPILNHIIYTNKITDEYINKIDSVKLSPSIFQTIIPKAYELRITVVENKLFAAKIDSQKDSKTALDWRRKPKLNDFEVGMEIIELPPVLEKDILLFMKKMSLQFGCIDMIVTPEEKYVFLEINPNGQWYFVQLKTHVNIAKAIVDLLTN